MTSFFESLGDDVSKFTETRVHDCIESPTETLLKDPVTKLAALYKYNYQPSHQCYWNNRFCIAIACDLPKQLQREAAWCAVSNGLNEYWEWVTHSNYDATVVLRRMGINDVPRIIVATGFLYCNMPKSIAVQLIRMFDLPTRALGVKKTLTTDEEEERDRFNHNYPHHNVM